MENICRKGEGHAMGIAPLLLCSEGQTTAQQGDGDPPALLLWLLPTPVWVWTLPTSPQHQPYSCYKKLKGQNSCNIWLSPSFNGKLVPSPHKLSKTCQESKEWCDMTKLCHRAGTASYTCAGSISAKELKKSKQKAKRYERVMVTRLKNISCNWEEQAGFNACYPCWCCINVLFCSILVLFQGQVYSVSFIIKLSIYSLDAIHWFCATRKRKLSLCVQHCHSDLIFLSPQYSVSPPRPGYLPGPTHFACHFYAFMFYVLCIYVLH